MTIESDIVVIGAGAAGMPAALFASKGSHRVTLIDAADRIGGTLHLSSGHMSAAGTRIQANKGIADSSAEHFDDVMRISRGTANPALTKLAVDHAADTIHWLLDNGLQIMPDHPIIHYGHEPYKTPRTYWGPEEGRSVLNVMTPMIEKAVAEGDIDLRLNTYLNRLERAPDGRIRLTLENGERSYKLEAACVIIATGGFASNPELFRELSGKPLYGGGWEYNQGVGLLSAVSMGGQIVNKDFFLPTFAGVAESDAPGGVTFVTQTYPQFRQPWEVYVDSEGSRFMREDDPSVDRRERALVNLPDMRFWALFDDRIRRDAPSFFTMSKWGEVSNRFNRLPAYRSAESISELAKLIGADPSILQATIIAYNKAVSDVMPDPFGREHRPLPLEEPPFYAVEHVGWSIVSFAGLGVDGDLRVVDVQDEPIDGLYAAGEVLGLGATAGNSFVGGMSVTPAMTFGRLLGQKFA